MDSSEIIKNLVSSNQIKSPKYTILSERERERLYEECFWETPYIGYYNIKEIEERQKKEHEKYIKSNDRNHF
jgi:tRNA A37 threonylcarbamoyladenosine biosynthesis protein TsaE